MAFNIGTEAALFPDLTESHGELRGLGEALERLSDPTDPNSTKCQKGDTQGIGCFDQQGLTGAGRQRQRQLGR